MLAADWIRKFLGKAQDLSGWMENIEGPINGACIGAHEVVMDKAGAYRRFG